MRPSFAIVAAIASWAHADTDHVAAKPATNPIEGQLTPQGCFSSKGNLTAYDHVLHVSSGNCWQNCQKLHKTVSAQSTDTCYCGDAYPPKTSLVKNAKCNSPCPGYDMEACGGLSSKGETRYFSVFNTGVKLHVPYFGEEKSSEKKSTSTAVNSSGHLPSTIALNPTPTATKSSGKGSKSSNSSEKAKDSKASKAAKTQAASGSKTSATHSSTSTSSANGYNHGTAASGALAVAIMAAIGGAHF